MKIYKVVEVELWNELMKLYKAKYAHSATLVSKEAKPEEKNSQQGGSQFTASINSDHWTAFEEAVADIKKLRPKSSIKKRQKRK